MEQIEYPKELECKHVFETHAIEQWLVDNNTCPLCRFQVNEKKSGHGTIHDNGVSGVILVEWLENMEYDELIRMILTSNGDFHRGQHQ